jgi:hypothetical protein
MNILNSHILYLKTLPNQGQNNKKDKVDLKGLGKSGPIKDTAQALNDVKEAFKDIDQGKIIDQVSNQFKKLLSDSNLLSTGINKLVAQKEELGKAFIKLSNQSSFLERRNRELQKTFAVNSVQAAELGAKYDSLGDSFGTGGKQIRKYAQELNRILPLQAKNLTDTDKANKAGFTFNSRLLKTAKIFRENLGLSAENVEGFARFTAGLGDAGDSTQDVAAQLTSFIEPLEKTTDLVGVTKSVLQDVSSLSSDVQLQFRNYPTNLGLAVLKTRMLGTSLGEVFSIGKNLLNIEQSVGNELEYQLLSGKRLVNQDGESLTQKFREATLMGDANATADAMNEILETQGDTIKDNFFARKKLAETLGISEEKLAGMVQQRELLEKAGPQAEKILKLPIDKMAGAIEEFREAAKDDPTRQKQLEAFDNLIKDRANQLSFEEKQIYYLEEIASNLIGDQVRLGGKSQAQIVKEQQAALTDPGAIKAATNIGNLVTGADDQQLVNLLGAFGQSANIFAASMDAFQATSGIVPIVGTLVTTIKEKIASVAFSGIDKLEATTVEAINVGSATINAGGGDNTTKGLNDFISRPGGPAQSFSSADTVIGAKAGGPIDQMLSMAGGGGGASIDYNAMAAAVASAMSNIQIVAPTDIYRDSEMNIQSIT